MARLLRETSHRQQPARPVQEPRTRTLRAKYGRNQKYGGASSSGSDSESGSEASNDSEEIEDSDGSEESDESNSEEEESSPEPPSSRGRGRANLRRKPRPDYLLSNVDKKQWRHDEAVRRFRYLLGLSDLFRHFVDIRAKRDPAFQQILDEADAANKKGRGRSGRRRRGKDNADEEREMMEDGPITVFDESPSFINGSLRLYQIDGLNWLISLYENCISGILADEMGLGKTLQCISFLAYLRYVRNIQGPHLVVVPKSTLQNWAREFAKWAPEFNVLVITGDKDERAELIERRLLPCDFDVAITSFELVIREKSALQRFAWHHVIVDEAHRIKNEESMLAKIMRVLFSRYRLLITGTPLQNNLHELWALLNFLLPDVFADHEVFDEWFQNSGSGGDEERDQDHVVEQLRKILRPFLLRRVKSDVERSLLPKREINLYVGMTDMQVKWYQRLLEKDLDAVNGGASDHGKMRLLNVVMQLRKCCNHPYLFEGAEPGPPFTTDEHLVQNSGKLILLDKLLKRLKEQGSRVLIFSQMGRMLDILEDYCSLRDYEYCRIDGSTVHEDRVAAIDDYSRPDSDKFLFLLTTRAGGLGINLTSADQVILYDSDWNPQADLQAMDRAHRIGQTKQVTVWRFVAENTIEDKVLERAAHKLRLDQLVIQQQGKSSSQEKAKAAASKEELVNMIRHGAQSMFDQTKGTMIDESIEDIIQHGEQRTKELNSKYSELGLDELQNFTFDAPIADRVVNTHKKPEEPDLMLLHSQRRARQAQQLFNETDSSDDEDKPLKPPKQVTIHDFQFFPPELRDLQHKEIMWYRKQAGLRLSSEDYSESEEDDSEQVNKEIEAATEFTEDDAKRKTEYIAQGFPSFTKRDFHHFINLLVRFGRNDVEAITTTGWRDTHSSDEVRRYYDVFFQRYKELNDSERYMNQLEAGEVRARKQNHQYDLLKQKVRACESPLSEMPINYPAFTTRRSYTELEDRFLILSMYELGLDTPHLHSKIRDRIRSCGIFDYDFYFQSRTPVEIGRRCGTLLLIISKEYGKGGGKRKRGQESDESEEFNKRPATA